MNRQSAGALAAALQLLALVALSLALLGVSWLDPRSRPRILVLVDRSSSVPRQSSDEAIQDVVRSAGRAGAGELRFLEFAGRPGAPSPRIVNTIADLEPSATNIEAALEAALADHAEKAYAGAVILSDGLENGGDTTRALRSAREARLPIQWIPVGRPAPPTRIIDVLAPDRASVGQSIQIAILLAGRLDKSLRVKVTARDAAGETQATSGEPDSEGRWTMELQARRSGAVVVDVALEDPSSGQTLDALPDAAVIDVETPAPILYVDGSTGSLAHSLLEGGWTLNLVSTRQLEAQVNQLEGYRVIVLDDIAIPDASPRFWNALVAAVQERGAGLLVLGGERSFSRGGYRGSTLESILPVLSEPAALNQPASVVFIVDKSGSMGGGSSGVDRFKLAQRAVLETARSLTDNDSLGLVVFDVEPRLLIPLGPARAGTAALSQAWPTSPHGGTKLAPALEIAIGELEHSLAARRIAILVTDGHLDNVPLAEWRARLDRARIDLIALAVGPDADVSALERLAAPGADIVVRVHEAAELPLAMRSELQRRRASIERGTIAVRQQQPLPFAPRILQSWPAIAAYAVTRSRSDATVAVQTTRGDPLVAFHGSGQGRVMAVTSGMGRWTPRWMQWSEWPRFAGGMTDWLGGIPGDGRLALSVSDLPLGIEVQADVGALSSNSKDLSLTINTPTAQTRLASLEDVAPGRVKTTLPDTAPGLYTFLLSTPDSTHRLLHLRRNRAEDEAWGTNPALKTWKRSGLVRDWDPSSLVRDSGNHQPDRWLVGLALALFVASILIDRGKAFRTPAG